mgnify:CR=1 FL=1
MELAVSQFSQQGVATLQQVVLPLAVALLVLSFQDICKALFFQVQLEFHLVVLVIMVVVRQQDRLLLRCLLLQRVAVVVLGLRLRP